MSTNYSQPFLDIALNAVTKEQLISHLRKLLPENDILKEENRKLKKENEKLTQRLEDKEDPDSWWESQYYECRDELHQAHIREAKLKHENVKVEKDNDKLEKEVSVLLAVASGDYKRADDFKALCKERFEEEFIDACDDDTLVGQYFTE